MKIKGHILNARKDFVRSNFGDAGWEKVVSAMPAKDQEVLKGVLLSSQWYLFEIGDRLDKAIVDVLGGGKKSFFEDLGAKSAQRSLSMEHKSFLSVGNPQAFMKKADMIYKFYYNIGRREYKETGPTSGVMTTYDAETFSVADCLTVIGWYRVALKMCGVKEVKIVEEECRATGGSCCRFRFEWKM
ncbi:MAG: hypothetical protein V1799_12980 [bacterium]